MINGESSVEPVREGDEFTMRGVHHIVTRVTPKSIRYRTDARDGFEGTPYTTTPGAFYSLVAAGLIHRAEA